MNYYDFLLYFMNFFIKILYYLCKSYNMKTWIYYGVFFSEKSQRALLNFAKRYIGIPDDWRVFCHHMTIIFNDKSEEKQEMAKALDNFIGHEQSLKITSIGVSDHAIALGVDDYVTQNKRAHITVAAAPGAKPVESNDIENWYSTDEDFYISGKLNVFMGNVNIK